jgi:hypothetical protein
MTTTDPTAAAMAPASSGVGHTLAQVARAIFPLTRGFILLTAIIAGGWWSEAGLTRDVGDGYGWYFQLALIPIALIISAAVGTTRWYYEQEGNPKLLVATAWIVVVLAGLHTAFCHFTWRAEVLAATSIVFAISVQLRTRQAPPARPVVAP